MAKLLMWNITSLNGFFEATTPFSLDWFNARIDEEFFAFATAQLHTAGTLVFGRKTYEGMFAHWPTATGEIANLMNAIPKLIFSHTLKTSLWHNATITADDPVTTLTTLKQQATKDLYIFGSANLSKPLLQANLFDEIRICQASVLIPEGQPLFTPDALKNFDLIEAKPLSKNAALLRYVPAE